MELFWEKTFRIILITGASSGIGRALAHGYAAPNITLYLSGRNQDALEQVKQQCQKKGAVVHYTAIRMAAAPVIVAASFVEDNAAPVVSASYLSKSKQVDEGDVVVGVDIPFPRPETPDIILDNSNECNNPQGHATYILRNIGAI